LDGATCWLARTLHPKRTFVDLSELRKPKYECLGITQVLAPLVAFDPRETNTVETYEKFMADLGWG
jgi:hypothetical protein